MADLFLLRASQSGKGLAVDGPAMVYLGVVQYNSSQKYFFNRETYTGTAPGFVNFMAVDVDGPRTSPISQCRALAVKALGRPSPGAWRGRKSATFWRWAIKGRRGVEATKSSVNSGWGPCREFSKPLIGESMISALSFHPESTIGRLPLPCHVQTGTTLNVACIPYSGYTRDTEILYYM